MSGGDVPYHLRPNKFVERQMYLDLLDLWQALRPLERYVYVSMGSRFLEDFRQLHQRFGLKDLVSIEMDAVICGRQMFNRPVSLIKCLQMKSGEFVAEFDRFSAKYDGKNFCVWLDYTQADKRQTQLREYRELVSKLSGYDIVKITMNASVATLAGPASEYDGGIEEQRAKALEKLRQKLQDTFPDEQVESADMTPSGLAAVLALAVKKAALKGLSGSPELRALPLASFRYNDGSHQMVTLTAGILPTADLETFETSRIGTWEYRAKDWDDVREILVPDMSVKERLRIEEELFSKADEEIHNGLPFRFDADDAASLKVFKAYVEHYRRYPSFQRVVG